ncbi:hypothetical protein MJO29_004534 [Puccinia striiformis f. sp. tritici]|nr:hypothetical protein MJO29_004534 [Puccinia striiformis f. sp. tritici]
MSTEDRLPLKRELIKLKPPKTPVQLEGDSSRGLQPVTYHPIHGILQQAPTISLKNQKVLEEDEYMEALSKIIKRDFFPSLDQFEKQKQEWLDQRRRKNNNNLLLQHSPSGSSSSFTNSNINHRNWSSLDNTAVPPKRWEDGGPTPKITQTCTPGRTPLRADTPSVETPRISSTPTSESIIGSSSQSVVGEVVVRKSYDETLSLDEFCSRYTSEDNSSFSEILNNANRLKRIKYAWAFDSSSKHNSRLLESTLKREHLIGMIGKMSEGGHGIGLIEGISGKPGERKMVENVVTTEERLAIQASEREDPKLITCSKTGKLQDFTTTPTTNNGKSVTGIDVVVDRHRQEIRNPDSWPHVVKNGFMFSPDANTSSHQPAKPPPFPSKPDILPGDPKSINHASTRMHNDDLLVFNLKRSRASSSSRHSLSSASPTRSQIAAAINGKLPNQSNGSPRVNGFSFVPELPTPDVEEMNRTSELDQLMTWGEIMTTPVRVDEGGSRTEDLQPIDQDEEDDEDEDDSQMIENGPFRISKRAKREELAIDMARKASKSLRQKFGNQATGLGIIGPRSSSKLRRSLLGDQTSSTSASTRDRSQNGSPLNPTKPQFNSPRREGYLSPAAKNLLKKTGGLSSSSASSSTRNPSSSSSGLKLNSPAPDHNITMKKKVGIFTPVRGC